MLADGLGGHRSGEMASAIAAETILTGISEASALDEQLLAEQLEAANLQVMEGQKHPGCEDMKTTAVVLAAECSDAGEMAVWGHVGDSRLYYFSGGELCSVTRDHSVTYMKYLGGEISYMDVYHDDDRSSLLRVLENPDAGRRQGGRVCTRRTPSCCARTVSGSTYIMKKCRRTC